MASTSRPSPLPGPEKAPFADASGGGPGQRTPLQVPNLHPLAAAITEVLQDPRIPEGLFSTLSVVRADINVEHPLPDRISDAEAALYFASLALLSKEKEDEEPPAREEVIPRALTEEEREAAIARSIASASNAICTVHMAEVVDDAAASRLLRQRLGAETGQPLLQ